MEQLLVLATNLRIVAESIASGTSGACRIMADNGARIDKKDK